MYPIVFRRKRTGPIFLNSLLLIFSVVMLVYGLCTAKEISLYIVAIVVFAGSLAFNIFLASEKTFVIDEEKIYSSSLFIPKISVRRKNIRSVNMVSDETELRVYYDNPEFNLKANFSDFVGDVLSAQTPWSFTISKKDVNCPLHEVEFIIKDFIIADEQNQAE